MEGTRQGCREMEAGWMDRQIEIWCLSNIHQVLSAITTPINLIS